VALFAGNKLYLREIKDPDTGEAYHVKLRKMDEGYRQERADLLMKTREDTRKKLKKLPGGKRKRREQITEYNLGTVRLSDLTYSIKEWDFVDEDGNLMLVNIQTIKKLDGLVADKIWDHIEELNPTVFNLDDDEDEDDEEYEDADEAEEGAGNGSVDAEALAPAVMFAEEEGPKATEEQS
jgi:hypothetical protein